LSKGSRELLTTNLSKPGGIKPPGRGQSMDKPNYYGILPAEIRYSKEISAHAKVLYSELTALSTKDGYCFASNSYFSKLYDKKPETISQWVAELVKAGFVRREVDKIDGNLRRIFINILSTPIPKKRNRSTEKTEDPYSEKSEVIYKFNNTRFNNKNNNKKISVEKSQLAKKMSF